MLLSPALHQTVQGQQPTSTASLFVANSQYLQGRTWADLKTTNGSELAAPAAPTLSQVAGGALAARTYYVKITYVNVGGETTASAQSSLAISANNLVKVTSPIASGNATLYQVYASTVSGSETKQTGTGIVIGTDWTEQPSGLISGAALPTANTTDLYVNVAPGVAVMTGTVFSFASTTAVAMTASATNYVFVDASGAISKNTTGYGAGTVPIAKVTTDSSSITENLDQRGMMIGFGGTLSLKNLNAIRFADQFSGANAGAKIQAAHDDLPSSGGTIDARGFETAQTSTATIALTKNITILWGAFTLTSTATPSISLAAGRTLKIIGVGRDPSGTGTGVSVLFHNTTGAAVSVGTNANLLVEDMTFRGGDPVFSIAASVAAGRHYTIHRNVFRECVGGLLIGASNPINIIEQNEFRCTSYSIDIDTASEGRISDNYFPGTVSLYNIRLRSPFYNKILRNLFVGTGTAAPDIQIDCPGGVTQVGTQISYNKFGQETAGAGGTARVKLVYSGVGLAQIKGWSIVGNSVANQGVSGNAPDFVEIASSSIAVLDSDFSFNYGLSAADTGYLFNITGNNGSIRNTAWGNIFEIGEFVGVFKDPSGFSFVAPEHALVNPNNTYLATEIRGSARIVDALAAAASSPSHDLRRAKGTVPAPTVVAAADRLGQVSFSGYDGASYLAAVAIRAEVGAAPGANDMPGRLLFMTAPDGTTALTERMTIHSSGGVSIGFAPDDAGEANLSMHGLINMRGGDTATIYQSRNTSAEGPIQFTIKHNLDVAELRNERGALSLVPVLNANVNASPSGTGKFVLTAGNAVPSATGQDLGATGTRWDLFGQTGDFSRALFSSVNIVTFSATPTFDASLGNTQKITLTGNVTSSTLSNASTGQPLYFQICQDATGGRTFVWPTNVKGGMTIGGTLSTCSAQNFIFDGTNAYALSAGVTNM